LTVLSPTFTILSDVVVSIVIVSFPHRKVLASVNIF